MGRLLLNNSMDWNELMKKVLLFLVMFPSLAMAQSSGPGLYGGGYPGAKYSGQQDMLADLIFNGSTSVTGSGSVAVAQTNPNFITGFSINSVPFATEFTAGANYNAIYSGAGTDFAFQSGNITDPTNYYSNTFHVFRSIAGATLYADINALGVKIYGATSGSALLAVQAIAGTPTVTFGTSSGTPAVTASSPLAITTATGNITCATCATSAASLTANQLVIGSGSQGTQSLGSLGTTTTVLHGNAAGAPTFGAVAIGDVSASTGTGSFVFSVAPTITGHPTIEGVTSTGATGTGNLVFSAAPTFTGAPILAAPSATTLIVGASATLPSPAIAVFTNNSTVLQNPSAGTVVQIGGANASGPILVLDAYGSNATLSFRTALGTAASPTALTTDTIMMNFGGQGRAATGYSAGNRLVIRGFASENWSDTVQGAYLTFITTPTGGTATTEAMRIQNSGGISVGTTTDLGVGTVLANGAIKTLSTTTSTSPTTGSGLFGGGIGVSGDVWASGNHSVSVAAKTLLLKQGANGAVGTFVCTGGGTITINNTNLAVSDAIIISLNTVGGTITVPPIQKTMTAATSFQVLCGGTDTSTYNYALIKNAA